MNLVAIALNRFWNALHAQLLIIFLPKCPTANTLGRLLSYILTNYRSWVLRSADFILSERSSLNMFMTCSTLKWRCKEPQQQTMKRTLQAFVLVPGWSCVRNRFKKTFPFLVILKDCAPWGYTIFTLLVSGPEGPPAAESGLVHPKGSFQRVRKTGTKHSNLFVFLYDNKR